MVVRQKKAKGVRVWESGEISAAHQATGCEEDASPSAHQTRLLLEDSWEQMTCKKNKNKNAARQKELSHMLGSRKPSQSIATPVLVTEKASH